MYPRYRRALLLTVCLLANVLLAFYVIPNVLLLTGPHHVQEEDRQSATSFHEEAIPASTVVPDPLVDVEVPSRAYTASTTGRTWEEYLIEPDLRLNRVNSKSNISLLILVCSAVQNVDRRRAIRSTWGNHVQLEDLGVRVVFVVARADPLQLSPDMERIVTNESRRYADVLQLNFTDDYVNLTLKTVSGLRWATSIFAAADKVDATAPKYIMKADDDIFLNVPQLLRRLDDEEVLQSSTFDDDQSRTSSATSFILGRVVDNAKAVRDRRSKWFTPQSVYSGEFYPPYVSGTGYVLGTDVVRRLVGLVDGRKTSSMFWLEDIYVTGMLAAQLDDVRLVDDRRFNFERLRRPRRHRAHWVVPPAAPSGVSVVQGGPGGAALHDTEWTVCAYRDAITEHDLTARELTTVWKMLQAANTESTINCEQFAAADSAQYYSK